jgi:hypothetical protein
MSNLRIVLATTILATALLTCPSIAQDTPPKAAGKSAPSAAPAAPGKASVTGKFTGNGKPAALAFISARIREPFADQEAITLIFTEKNHAASKKPEFDAAFGEFGSAITLSLHRDGKIFGCDVRHTNIEKSPFTSIGNIKFSDLVVTDTNISGKVATTGPQDIFGEKWDVDLKFSVPLPPKAFVAAAAPPKPAKPADDDDADAPADAPPKAPAGPLIAVRDLPLPKGAAGVDYKQLVQQIDFTSPQTVEAVAKEFSASLKKQGWKDGAGNLLTKKNAILHRENGAAKLTIMVKPADGGSSVKIFTEGMDWTNAGAAADPTTPTADLEKPKTKPGAKPAKNPAPDFPDTDEIEKAAEKLLEEALKSVPK